MFEFLVALKYLIPRRRQLSVSLIALVSVMVISLVVWLVLVFLSVTAGIERSWLEKLTALNAPLRITPTPAYYSSYYYLSDSVSGASNYRMKSIAEKANAPSSDPYDPKYDSELPFRFPRPDRHPSGELKDPVKGVFQSLYHLQTKYPDLVPQDFEMSGGLVRLEMTRSSSKTVTSKGDEVQSLLTQVSYLLSFSDKSPSLSGLIQPPTVADLNQLLFAINHEENFREKVQALFAGADITGIKSSQPYWKVPFGILPEESSFRVDPVERNGKIAYFVLTDSGTNIIHKKREKLIYNGVEVSPSLPLIVDGEVHLSGSLIATSIEKARSLSDLHFFIKTKLQNETIQGIVPFDGLEVENAEIRTQWEDINPSPWVGWLHHRIALPTWEEWGSGVLVGKNLKDSGIKIGDRGYLSYSSTTASAQQEQRLPIFVAGFYDPGVIGIGSKCILVPHFIAQTVNASNHAYAFDKTQSSGILVWFNDLYAAETIKKELCTALQQQGIDSYWKVTSFRDYENAKDLIQQFQSDKYLFTIVATLILAVGCSNVVSMLVLLVNDKKKEIGIMQAMGASKKSIAKIFGLCGLSLGLLSTAIGTGAALLTLHHIDKIAAILSFLQGHDAFNVLFYGNSLPSELSGSALFFILVATPLLSLIAGLVPAWKACRLKPSEILKDL